MEELLQLETEVLKDAAQRLWQHMCAPTCDGKLTPADVYHACRDGGVSGIEFIIGFSGNEMQTFRSFAGDQKYENFISAALTDMQNSVDVSAAGAVQEYIEAQKISSGEPEAKTKIVEQWLARCIYRSAVKLEEGGNQVHLMYWDEEPLIENLGSGTVDAAASLLGNGEALQMYGGVMNEDLSGILQSLLQKYISGNALQLYPNEIKGIDALDWEAFPRMLVIANGKIVTIHAICSFLP